ncbi:helix-turn-helix domain-containing protein [Streptomyces qinzhouensis]|uniref:helix-turn-helix domain-containing protein n=1 Tax=Streptomyces qinzhouensis TaxID=2599401 RepID=UPI001C93F739|nr:helix-turn-helix transcriptional regulator [Streptomyces qinzhouensis]
MANQRERSPREARDTAELAALLRNLKDRSGLTYRALEETAARRGDVLPRSTLATVLNGRGLPRPELLAAFVRACGDGARVDEWLDARARIAGRTPEPVDRPPAPVRPAPEPDAPTGPDEPDPDVPVATAGSAAGPPGQRPRRSWRRTVMFAVPVLAAALIGLWLVAAPGGTEEDRDTGDRTATATAQPNPTTLPPNGYVRLRPVSAPRLCLTDGRLIDGRYTPLVAVQDSCDSVAPQSTTLEPLGGDSFRIVWHHPDYGKGCLKALAEGTGRGLLEPWDECALGSRFHVELSGPPGGNTFVLRVDGQGCVGIKGGSTALGAEAVMGRCTAADHQIFVIERI